MSISISYNLTPYKNVLCVILCHRHLIWFSYKFKYEFIPAGVWYNQADIDSWIAVDETSMQYLCVWSMSNLRRFDGLFYLEISESTFCCCVEIFSYCKTNVDNGKRDFSHILIPHLSEIWCLTGRFSRHPSGGPFNNFDSSMETQ